MGQAAHRPLTRGPRAARERGVAYSALCILEKNAHEVKSASVRQSPRQLGRSLPGKAGFVSGAAGRGPLKERRPPKADALVQFDALEVERLSPKLLKAMAGYHDRYAGQILQGPPPPGRRARNFSSAIL